MQHRMPIAAILSALTALKRGGGGGGVMLKNPGGALRAFIGAGFCAVILSLSACASKGAADIPIGGGGNVGGGNVVEPELQDLPTVSNTETLSGLNALATSMTPDASAIRSGGDGDSTFTNPFGPITERQYDFTDSSIIVQQLEFAHLGVWMDGDVADDTLRYRYANLAENIPATPPATSIGTATYNVEGDAFFNGLRFYPDGSMTVNFDTDNWQGGFTVIGNAANVDDDFGVGATIPDGTPDGRSPAGTDILSFSISRGTISGGEFSGDLIIGGASGFFVPLDVGDGTFSGRFHDADGYDGTAAPAELSGTFILTNQFNDNPLGTGGFLGECTPTTTTALTTTC